MASRKSAACVLAAVVAAAAAAAVVSAETTTVIAVKGETGETYDVAAATALALPALVDTATPVVASNPAAEEETHPVVGSVDMTLADGTVATLTLHEGEDAVTEVRRWLQAHNAVDADVDVKFRTMLVALKTADVVEVTPETLLAYLPLTVVDGVTYKVPLLSSEAPEESVRGFLRRMDLLATMPSTSTDEAVRAAREVHTYEMERRVPLSVTLYNVTIEFTGKSEDMDVARKVAAEAWHRLDDTVRAGLNEMVFVTSVSRAIYRAARISTLHPILHVPWDATVPFTLDRVTGEMNLKEGDDLGDKVLETCATHLIAARRVLGKMTAPNDVVLFECGGYLMSAVIRTYLVN